MIEMTRKQALEILKIVNKQKDLEFSELDKKYSKYFKEEYIDTPIDYKYQEEFKELQTKYHELTKPLKELIENDC